MEEKIQKFEKSKYALGIVIILLLFVFSAIFIWSPNDDKSSAPTLVLATDGTETFDHEDFSEILEDYVHPMDINRVDYTQLQKNPETLEVYLEKISKTDPANLTREEQKAFLINAYNAYTLKIATDHYPLDTLKELDNGKGPWDVKAVKINNSEYSLNDVEHEFLRKEFRDPMIHFGINCASYGCPDLRRTIFSGKNVDSELEKAAKAYINHPRAVDIDKENNTIKLSSIFNWFSDDFQDKEDLGFKKPNVLSLITPKHKEKVVLEFIAKYLENPDDKQFIEQFTGDVVYEYDWTLNDVLKSPDTYSKGPNI